MHWRYQPVCGGGTDDPWFMLIEVFLDDSGGLCGWSSLAGDHPAVGDSHEDLIRELELMLRDAREWKPVAYVEITKETVFERLRRGLMRPAGSRWRGTSP